MSFRAIVIPDFRRLFPETTPGEEAGWRLKAVRDDVEHNRYHLTGKCYSVLEEGFRE